MEATIRCFVYPTEDKIRVEQAIKNLLGPIDLVKSELEELTELVSIEKDRSRFVSLRQSIHDKRILDAVRVRLLKNLDEFTTCIFFDKQAAYTGKLRVIDNNHVNPPLGSIEIKFDFKSESQFEEFLDWFSPRTKGGKIIS
ncbi:MAG: RNA-binding domain-containing protein [Candidatus Thorarchaeota archaeon]